MSIGSGRMPPRRSWRWPSARSSRATSRLRFGWRARPSGRSGAAATPGGSARRRCWCCGASARPATLAGGGCGPSPLVLAPSRCRVGQKGAPPGSRADLLAIECELRAGSHPDVVAPRLPAVRDTDSLQSRLQSREVRALAAIRRGQGARASAEIRRGSTSSASTPAVSGRWTCAPPAPCTGSRWLASASSSRSRPAAPPSCSRPWSAGGRSPRAWHGSAPPADARTAELLSELRRCEEAARGLEDDPSPRARSPVAHAGRDPAARHPSARVGAGGWHRSGAHARTAGERGARSGPDRRYGVRDLHRAPRPVAGCRRLRSPEHGRRPGGDRGGRRAGAAGACRPRRAVAASVAAAARRGGAPLSGGRVAPARRPVAHAPRRGRLPAGRLVQHLAGAAALEHAPLAASSSRRRDAGGGFLAAERCRARRTRPRVVALAGPGLHRAEDEAKRVVAHWSGRRP